MGGHTHSFLDKPHVVTRKGGGRTHVVQVGFAGTHLGQVDLDFTAVRPAVASTVHPVWTA